ncbi:MAG TPA: hypothetical protein P5277_05000 [Candidatus Paceibacterota bacterium]|nr:hypothetical protein [Candidatus Paceibacterota bacterium]
MDQGLKAQIHRYAENREIDYLSAKNLGNAYGIEFANENELVEFKQTIDRYLKTFEDSAFEAIEEACKKKKKKKVVEESYDIEAYADDDKMIGGFKPNKKGQKNPMKKVDTKRYKPKFKPKSRKQNESKSLDDFFN